MFRSPEWPESAILGIECMPKPIAFSIIGLFLGFYSSIVLLPKGNLLFISAKNVSYFWAIRVLYRSWPEQLPLTHNIFSRPRDSLRGQSVLSSPNGYTFSISTIKTWQGIDGNDNDNNLCASCRRPIYKQNINQQENTAVELSYFFSRRVLVSFQVSRDEFESFTHTYSACKLCRNHRCG